MATQYATLHVQLLKGEDTNETILALEQFLEGAAYEADGVDFEIFYVEKDRVVAIRVPFEDSSYLSFLEAGATLGSCHQQIMESGPVRCLSFWKSVDALDGTTIASPV